MEVDIIPTLQALIDAHEHPFVLIDREYRVVVANDAYRDAYGIELGRPIERRCFEVLRGRHSPCWQHGEDCPHREVFQHRGASERVPARRDSTDRHQSGQVRGYPIPVPDGGLLLGESVFRLSAPRPRDGGIRMIGSAPAFLHAVEQLRHAADGQASVLLCGESGVGKELAAHHVHEHSPRRDGPFLVVDCASLSETLFESEIFGHERGAFTSCVGRKRGLFELAHRGTLFLDEIGELSLAMQAKLLRVLETGQFRRLGGREFLHADVRVIAATNRNLQLRMRQGEFREDLYYRLACITVHLPPLRARRSDISALAEVLLARINHLAGTRCSLTEEALERLVTHDFPGNVRELRNLLHRAVSLCKATRADAIHARHISFDRPISTHAVDDGSTTSVQLPMRVDRSPPVPNVEASRLAELLSRFGGHRQQVARAMGVSERTLYRKLRRYGLNQA